MSEPKGFCPFCDIQNWHVCDHFAGYLRDGFVEHGRTNGRRALKANEVAVPTGVSIRVYSPPKNKAIA